MLKLFKLWGVLQFIWHYGIDMVERGVAFLARPVYCVDVRCVS